MTTLAYRHDTISELKQLNEQAWLRLGNVAESLNELDKAMELYRTALNGNHSSTSAMEKLAELCQKRQKFHEAVEYYKKILSIKDKDGETWAKLGHCCLAMDDTDATFTAYQTALHYLPNPYGDAGLWYGIGILHDNLNNLDEASKAFSVVIKFNPKFQKVGECYFRLGIIYKGQKKFDMSLQCFRYILNNPPKPLKSIDIWFHIGDVFESQFRFKEAKEAYDQALSLRGGDPKILQRLGRLYLQPDTDFVDFNKSIELLKLSLQSDGEDADTWYYLGRCYMCQNDYNKAHHAYQQAVYHDAQDANYWASIGRLYFLLRQYSDALAAYTRCTRLDPTISSVWFNLGALYESCNGQMQEAIEAYTRAVQLDKDNVHYRLRLNIVQKDYDKRMAMIKTREARHARHQRAEEATHDQNPMTFVSSEHDSRSPMQFDQWQPAQKPSSMPPHVPPSQSSPSAQSVTSVNSPKSHIPRTGHISIQSIVSDGHSSPTQSVKSPPPMQLVSPGSTPSDARYRHVSFPNREAHKNNNNDNSDRVGNNGKTSANVASTLVNMGRAPPMEVADLKRRPSLMSNQEEIKRQRVMASGSLQGLPSSPIPSSYQRDREMKPHSSYTTTSSNSNSNSNGNLQNNLGRSSSMRMLPPPPPHISHR